MQYSSRGVYGYRQEIRSAREKFSTLFDKVLSLNFYLDVFRLPVEKWPETIDNYLLIGSEYANGMGNFGICIQDLQKDDPPVYWRRDIDSFSTWKLENEKLSDFLPTTDREQAKIQMQIL